MPRGQYPRKKGKRTRRIKQNEPELIRKPQVNTLQAANGQGVAVNEVNYVTKKVPQVILKREEKVYFSDGTTRETVETFPAVHQVWE